MKKNVLRDGLIHSVRERKKKILNNLWIIKDSLGD